VPRNKRYKKEKNERLTKRRRRCRERERERERTKKCDVCLLIFCACHESEQSKKFFVNTILRTLAASSSSEPTASILVDAVVLCRKDLVILLHI
jgi:hypothetical protein